MDPSAPAADRLHQSRPSTSHDEGADATTTTRGARKDAVAEYARLKGNQRPWRRVILYFEPSWFSVNMGTGVVSILLHNLPHNAEWLYWISVVVFCLNVVLFILFFIISVLRYTAFPGVWGCMIRHPVQSLFLGTCPMGLATIINMIVFVCVPAWGTKFATLAWALWWIDVVGAVGTCFYLPFIIMYKHEAIYFMLRDRDPHRPNARRTMAKEACVILYESRHLSWDSILGYRISGSPFSRLQKAKKKQSDQQPPVCS
ncbi:Sulfite efflux pump SSU1 like protein [Verticillium longisporum]|nr:Sulfite efflux pump SSU1 like protein [Verticillium longisporum]